MVEVLVVIIMVVVLCSSSTIGSSSRRSTSRSRSTSSSNSTSSNSTVVLLVLVLRSGNNSSSTTSSSTTWGPYHWGGPLTRNTGTYIYILYIYISFWVKFSTGDVFLYLHCASALVYKMGTVCRGAKNDCLFFFVGVRQFLRRLV